MKGFINSSVKGDPEKDREGVWDKLEKKVKYRNKQNSDKAEKGWEREVDEYRLGVTEIITDQIRYEMTSKMNRNRVKTAGKAEAVA